MRCRRMALRSRRTLLGILRRRSCSGWSRDRTWRDAAHTKQLHVGVLGYALATGAGYTAFSALIFYAIGKGAASTKCAVLGSFGNVPVDGDGDGVYNLIPVRT